MRKANNGLTKHFQCINGSRDKFMAKLHALTDQFSATEQGGVGDSGS